MAISKAYARVAAAAVTAFACGVLFASAADFTGQADAQQQQPNRPTASEVQPLVETSNAFVRIAESVTPAVVSIETTREARPAARSRQRAQPVPPGVPPGFEDYFRQYGDPRESQPQEASGSGFIVTKDGYILTNNHVVEGADRVTVTLTDHRSFRARVIGRDPQTDVAVIKIEGTEFPTVALGDDERTRIGDWVVAIGNPLGLDFTVTAGIVSAKGRGGAGVLAGLRRDQYAITDLIQTDAAINPGNSGGPLVNIRGEVIGINNSIASPTGFYTGYGFAIPISLARTVMDDLVKHGRVRRAVLGIEIADVTAEDAGVAGIKTITGVRVERFSGDNENPARRAGLEPNDVIVAIDGRPVDRVSALQRYIRTKSPGETVQVDAMRYGSRKSFPVRLTEAPSAAQVASATPSDANEKTVAETQGRLGISLEPVSAEIVRQFNLAEADRGLLVTNVSVNGPARRARLGPNDIIVEVVYPQPRRAVRTAADLRAALSRLRDGEFISLRVVQLSRDGRTSSHIVNLRVGE